MVYHYCIVWDIKLKTSLYLWMICSIAIKLTEKSLDLLHIENYWWKDVGMLKDSSQNNYVWHFGIVLWIPVPDYAWDLSFLQMLATKFYYSFIIHIIIPNVILSSRQHAEYADSPSVPEVLCIVYAQQEAITTEGWKYLHMQMLKLLSCI